MIKMVRSINKKFTFVLSHYSLVGSLFIRIQTGYKISFDRIKTRKDFTAAVWAYCLNKFDKYLQI